MNPVKKKQRSEKQQTSDEPSCRCHLKSQKEKQQAHIEAGIEHLLAMMVERKQVVFLCTEMSLNQKAEKRPELYYTKEGKGLQTTKPLRSPQEASQELELELELTKKIPGETASDKLLRIEHAIAKNRLAVEKKKVPPQRHVMMEGLSSWGNEYNNQESQRRQREQKARQEREDLKQIEAQNQHERPEIYQEDERPEDVRMWGGGPKGLLSTVLKRESKVWGVCDEMYTNFRTQQPSISYNFGNSITLSHICASPMPLGVNAIVFAATQEVGGNSYRPRYHNKKNKIKKSNMFLVPFTRKISNNPPMHFYIKMCLVCPATRIEVRHQLLEKLPKVLVEGIETFTREGCVNHSFCKHTPMLWNLLAQGRFSNNGGESHTTC